MFNGSNCDRKSQLSGILTEPLNPRDIYRVIDNLFVSLFVCPIIAQEPQKRFATNCDWETR